MKHKSMAEAKGKQADAMIPRHPACYQRSSSTVCLEQV